MTRKNTTNTIEGQEDKEEEEIMNFHVYLRNTNQNYIVPLPYTNKRLDDFILKQTTNKRKDE